MKFHMKTRTVIEQLGYSPAEASVYLAALELGASSATDIAKKARIPRTSVNLIIAALNKKGLISAYIQRKRKIWSAENPEKLPGCPQGARGDAYRRPPYPAVIAARPRRTAKDTGL